jgi:hypothetical protein
LVVLPSLGFFIVLSLLLRYGWSFWPGLGSSCVVMSAVYFGYVYVMSLFGMKL